jgi:integrase/recombinase XerD
MDCTGGSRLSSGTGQTVWDVYDTGADHFPPGVSAVSQLPWRTPRRSRPRSFQSLFEFASKRLKVAPSALLLEELDATLICTFLEHLETTRGNSAETRNIRLAAFRSFFRFLQHREPAAVEQVRRVLAIPFKKTDTRLVPYLVQEEMQALLDAPDPSTRKGIRDRAMLHLAVCPGLRVSELIGLRMDDVAPQSASIRVRGKGRRERALPLWKTTAAALRAWSVVRGPVASPELFVNARGQPLSRWGVAYVLRRHTETADRKCRRYMPNRYLPTCSGPHKCHGGAASDARHPESLPMVGA